MTKDKNGKKKEDKDPKKEPAKNRAMRRWGWFKKDPTDHKEY